MPQKGMASFVLYSYQCKFAPPPTKLAGRQISSSFSVFSAVSHLIASTYSELFKALLFLVITCIDRTEKTQYPRKK